MPDYITHGLVAMEKNDNSAYVAGNLFTDLGILVNLKLGVIDMKHRNMVLFAKYLKSKNYNKHFIAGLIDHIKVDGYGHPKYIYPKAKALASRVNVDERVAHVLVEFATAKKIIKLYPGEVKILKENVWRVAQDPKLHHYVAEFFGKHGHKLTDNGLEIFLKNEFTTRTLIKAGLIVRTYINKDSNINFTWWPAVKKVRTTYKLVNQLTDDYEDFLDDMFINALNPYASRKPISVILNA